MAEAVATTVVTGSKESKVRPFRFLIIALSLVLAGCLGPPSGLLRPVPVDVPTGSSVNMLVATTREPSKDPGIVFTGERGEGVSFADIVISLPPGRQTGTLRLPRSAPGNPRTDFVATSVTPMTRADIPRWFNGRGQKRHRVFIFVHGFNTRFDASVFRFAQIAHDVDADAEPVLFSWPSRGRLIDYNYDRESANFSRGDLAYLLKAAATNPRVSEITVLAHSMGSWIAVEALRDIALSDGKISPKINNVILASPDLDVDVFIRQMQEIGPKRPQITVFTSSQDRALGISSLIAGQVTRLGRVDVMEGKYRERLAAIPRLTIIDTSQSQTRDTFNHNAFATNPMLVRLIGDNLLSGRSITESDRLDPADAVQVAGSVAGSVVSVPFLIFRDVKR